MSRLGLRASEIIGLQSGDFNWEDQTVLVRRSVVHMAGFPTFPRVEALQRGKTFFSSRVSDLIMDGYKRHRVAPASSNVAKLSPREREVVQLVCEGKASKEIATILSMSLATGETHRSNILRKLDLHSIAELVLYAVRLEIIHVHLPTALSFHIPLEE